MMPRSGDIADFFHKAGPVGAKLERHGDARNNAHRERQCKDFHPKTVGFHPAFFASAVVA
jgi:hypothetical protein